MSSAKSDDSFWAVDDFPNNCPSGEYVVQCITQSLMNNEYSAVGLALRASAGVVDKGSSSGRESRAAAAHRIVHDFVRATGIPFHSPPPETGSALPDDATHVPATVPCDEAPNVNANACVRAEQTETRTHTMEKAPHTDAPAALSTSDASDCVSQSDSIPAPSSSPTAVSTRRTGAGGSSRLAQLIAEAKIAFLAAENTGGVVEATPPEPRGNTAASTKKRADEKEEASSNASDAVTRGHIGRRHAEVFGQESRKRGRGRECDGGSDADEESEEEEFGVVLPGIGTTRTALTRNEEEAEGRPEGAGESSAVDGVVSTKHPSQMTREEFLSQFKRAPRRGEIGQSAEEIAAAEKLGYVMSGSRSIGAQMYVDRVQRQLHEREASKLQRQFRKVEDERMDDAIIDGLVHLIHAASKPS